jgi:predicted PurR-regulated permease PerM/CheY-like chemotaxis protein
LRSLSRSRLLELAIFVAMLAFGKPVLMPISLAFYLAFVLTPPSNQLERLGVPRSLSVTAVVGTALTIVGVLGTVLLAQAADLSRQLKTYAAQMSDKLAGLRHGSIGALSDLSSAFTELTRALDPSLRLATPATPVRLVADGQSALERLEGALGPLLQPLAVVTVVFVLAIFMLANREDLRGRLIQLVGPENLTVTTHTMAEAVNRVSRLLLTQAYINTGFGAVIALGLYLIGTPYALLWGVIAALLRFVPLLGALIATLLPTLVAFAVFPGLREALLTLGFFFVVEAVVNNVVEPMVLGKRTGVSALALLMSALFWTWLWGPAGLILATPFTVCAAVVGRHVPELAFLTIMLGDDAGLNPEVNFYQRTLAKATKDAWRLAKRMAGETSLSQTYDELLVPALGLMVHDLNLEAITPAVADRVVQDVAEIANRLRPLPASAADAPASGRRRIVGVAAESNADPLLLQMLRALLGDESVDLAVVSGSGRAEILAAALREQPDVVVVAALPPSGNVNARFLCRRLRAELPEAYILVFVPESESSASKEAAARLREAGANGTAASLREASRLLLEQMASA